MNPDQLFIHTIKDIEKRLMETDPYEILMIAGLLRKLILDAESLVDQINKSKRLKINFTINNRPVSQSDIWSVEDGLDPETSAPHMCKPKEVTKDQLLSTNVLKISNHIFTIKDIILHIANVEGAIHRGTTKEEKDKILKQFIQEWQIGGISATLRLLKAIARVVVKGLKPLELSLG